VEDRRVKAVVMITVAIAWLAYVVTELARDRTPDVWTWGILTGVYAALYQPWTGKRGGGGQNEPGGLAGGSGPKRWPVGPGAGGEDEAG
jgi:hypothetical protein